jgi:FkbM family methyltransferase
MGPVNNFTVIESIYGKFIINRHCAFQAEHLIKTGVPHIHQELNILMFIAGSLEENCVVVDAGANAGLITIPIAQAIKGKNGIVYAFEPQTQMYYALCGSVALNDLTNVEVHDCALGSRDDEVDVVFPDYSKPQDFGLFSLNDDHSDDFKKTNIPVRPLDSLDIPRLDLLKIDVEGMEVEVLRGAKQLIRKHSPWCWVEYWKSDIEQIKKAFDGLAYRFYKADGLNLICVPECRMKDPNLKIEAQEV